MRERRRARNLAALAAAVLLIDLLLVQPNHPAALTPGALWRLPLELPVVVLILVLAPWAAVRAAVAAALTLLALVKLADLAAQVVYLRPFNPVLDVHLLPASWRMLSGAAGTPLALAAVAAVALAAAGVAGAVWWASGRIARVHPPPRLRPWLAALALPALGLAAIDAAGAGGPFNPPGSALSARVAWEHLRDGWRARGDLARFRGEAARDPFAGLPPDAILPALRGTDVALIFVESYGRSAIENPRYAPAITGTLAGIEDRLAARGLAMRSGFLTAPMVGGQSWLAHASVLSGLRIDTQGRYGALIASPRRTLLHLARAAGWHTAAVMPGITRPWPEGRYFGYDSLLDADLLGYRGLPFNWVTMPDQYTLSAFERRMLKPGPRPPVFAEIALISSHAPWTPVPPLLPWEAVGDGQVFDPFATAGDPPEVVWRDPDRVRAQYALALDYSLRVIGSFAERRAGQPLVLIVLGDHQPVGFVSGDAQGRDVPVHMIGPPEAVARIAGWGWTEGMIPAADAPAWPMHAFRDRFLAAFGPAVEDTAALAR